MEDKIKEMSRQRKQMAQLAESGYDEDGVEELLSLTSMVVDFCYWLRRVQIDKLNQYDAEDNCPLLFAVVDTFTHVSGAYYVLIGSVDSHIDWGEVSVSSIKELMDLTYEKQCSRVAPCGGPD